MDVLQSLKRKPNLGDGTDRHIVSGFGPTSALRLGLIRRARTFAIYVQTDFLPT